jgi:Tol biopolymer transport system component
MRTDRALKLILTALSLSVLVTGALALALTLSQATGAGRTVAEATPSAVPTAEPRVAFASDQEGEAAIYVMDADGSNRRRVSGEDQGLCLFPTWSPDGERVAFLELSERAEAGVWVSALDGSMRVSASALISTTPYGSIDGVAPVWSIDGVHVVFVSLGEPSDAALQIARADGSSIDHTIPLTGYQVAALRRSPVSECFLLVGSEQGGATNTYTMSVRSATPTLILTGTTAADWSPDGKQIALAERATQSILVVDRDGAARSIAQLATTPMGVSWSPDGELMAVIAAGNERQGYYDALYVVDVESGEITPLVDGEAWVDWPQWSADGERLLFTRGPLIRRAGLPYANLWIYDVVSGDVDQLTAGQGFAGLGTWSP